MRWTCYLTKNREKPYRWLQAPYQKCTAKFLWTSLPSFSKSTQREHSIITVEKGISVDQPKTLLPLNHCFSQTSELDKRRCILSEVVPESAFKYYCDLFNRRSYQNSGFDVFVLDIQIFSSYGDRSQISQMKVTDGWGTVCCHHSAKKGSTWLQVILLSYGLFRTESEWGVVASIQWKARLASVFSTLQIFSSKGVWWVRDCSLPSFSDKKASLHLVWLVSFNVYLWWWRCWIWACSIFLSEHGSETRHGKRPEPRATLCLLEYDCGANALG